MNPASLEIDLLAVQSKKEMNRNRLDNELGETNKIFGSMLFNDEGSSNTLENMSSARQQPERSGAHEPNEVGE